MMNAECRTGGRAGSSRYREAGTPGHWVNQRVLCYLTFCCLLSLPVDLPGQSPTVEFLGKLPAVLNESSGVAVSRQNTGILWTHNDSGHDPVLYAIDMSGELLAELRLESVSMDDWEDLSLGPCIDPAYRCLYVADIGDNMKQRHVYGIYIIAEPVVLSDSGVRASPGGSVQRLEFRYPDGSHDAEGLAVSPAGDVYVVTKGWAGTARGYIIPRDEVVRAVEAEAVVTASAVAGLSIQTGSIPYMITGAAISQAGRTMVVRTYLGFHFFAIDGEGNFEPREQPCTIGYREPQGEAVDFLDDSTLVLTSESLQGRPGTIHRVRCGA